jgi:hypothetical protein
LTDSLQERGLSTSGGSLGQTCVDRYLGVGIGQGEVLDDLLDAPLVGILGRRAKLGLGGVESLEGAGYLLLELLKDGIHGAGLRYTTCLARNY